MSTAHIEYKTAIFIENVLQNQLKLGLVALMLSLLLLLNLNYILFIIILK